MTEKENIRLKEQVLMRHGEEVAKTLVDMIGRTIITSYFNRIEMLNIPPTEENIKEYVHTVYNTILEEVKK